ncbi:MAG: hypothetical protein ABSF84_01745 [Acidimicrobiales bacterium]|jgi:hypothetical protein
MNRTIMSGVGALALALGATVGTIGGSAGATRVPVTFSGPISCTLAGGYHFAPALTNAGGSQTTVTFKGRLTGCSGSGATSGTATITTGRLIATSSTTVPNSFGEVTGGLPLPTLTGTIVWKATGGHVTPTTVSLTNQAISYDTGTTVVSLYATPVLGAGSFAGQSATANDMVANSSGFTLSVRAGLNGVKSITFGASGSTFTVGGAA